MKRKSSISFGPGASSLILIFVVLAMSVLGMLSLMNSRSDIRLSERSVKVTEAVYALQTRAEERRAQIAEAVYQSRANGEGEEVLSQALYQLLPDGAEVENGAVAWQETDGFRNLYCAVDISDGGEGTGWLRFNLTAETEEEW